MTERMMQHHATFSPQADARAAFTIPTPVSGVLSVLPKWPGSVAFASGLNLLLAPHLPADVAEAMRNRHVRVQVRDARITFDFCWTGQAFTVLADRAGQLPDLTISATAADFLALARREQDPDTLFFARRLVMEGDTELGLMLKNMLDAMDLSVFDPRHWQLPHPRAVAGSLWSALPPLSALPSALSSTLPALWGKRPY